MADRYLQHPVRDERLVENVSDNIQWHPVGMQLYDIFLHTYGMLSYLGKYIFYRTYIPTGWTRR